MLSVMALKNNNDQMVVSIDGNWYVLTLPDKQLFSHLLCFERPERLFSDWIANRSILLAQDLPHCQEVSVEDPVHCSSEQIQVAFRPLLIPLGPDGKRSFELSSTPDGEKLEGGCLYDACSHLLEDSFWTMMPFLPGMCLPRAYSPENPRQVYDQTIFLGDTHPGIPPLKWICVQGMLLAKQNLMSATPQALWDLGCVIKGSSISKIVAPEVIP